MKELLRRMVVWLLGISLTVVIVVDFRWLLLSPRDAATPAIVVRHTWDAAAMRRHIHAGMLETQVRRLLGEPSYVETNTPPGDIPRDIDLCQGYYGRDGSVFVYYYEGKGGEIVSYTASKPVSFDGTGT